MCRQKRNQSNYSYIQLFTQCLLFYFLLYLVIFQRFLSNKVLVRYLFFFWWFLFKAYYINSSINFVYLFYEDLLFCLLVYFSLISLLSSKSIIFIYVCHRNSLSFLWVTIQYFHNLFPLWSYIFIKGFPVIIHNHRRDSTVVPYFAWPSL